MVQVGSSRTENTQFNDFSKYSDDAGSTLDRNSPLVSMGKKESSTAVDCVQSGWPLWNRLLWSAHLIESLNKTKHAVFARRRS
ncbi:hypothetical protein TNCV_3484421 [Trichonephila clavipes]|nr:hypothetical protein TNCV_3484421 [Trichonephila clavipes]